MRFNNDEVWYDTALVCLNGDVINTRYHDSPEDNRDRCPRCGEPTIYKCIICSQKIKGYKHYPNLIYADDYQLPDHCDRCGKAYPWAEKRNKAREQEEIKQQIQEKLEEQKKLANKALRESQRHLRKITKEVKHEQKKIGRIRKILVPVYHWGYKLGVDIGSEALKKWAEQRL